MTAGLPARELRGPQRAPNSGTRTHTGKRGFWDIEKGWKGIGFVMSDLYKMYDRKYVHDVWFHEVGQIQQIGAGALVKVNKEDNDAKK